MQRRYADQSPAWLLPRLAAIQNLRGLWDEQAKKRAHDHQLQYRAMGAEDIVKENGGNDMPGDINITGDTYYVGGPPSKQEAPVAQTVPQRVRRAKSKVWPVLLALSLLGGGGGFGYMLTNWLNPPQEDKDTDTDTITEMDFPPAEAATDWGDE